MSKRKGLGKGQGKGYKNILMAHDKRVHKDSGRGRKQPQQIPNNLVTKGMLNVNKTFGSEMRTLKIPKKWKKMHKTFSDGSKLRQWETKNKRLTIHDEKGIGSGWVVSVTSLKKNELSQLMSDTNNTKQQAYKKAIKYMQENQ